MENHEPPSRNGANQSDANGREFNRRQNIKERIELFEDDVSDPKLLERMKKTVRTLEELG